MINFLVVLVLTPLLMVIEGLMYSMLWKWFVLPVFTGLPELTFKTAYGLSIFLVAIKAEKFGKSSSSARESTAEQFAYHVIGILLFWAFAYLIHLWIG